MKGIWQAATILSIAMTCVSSADEPKAFAWEALKVTHSMFTQELGMLGPEREEYATNLAQYAANRVAAEKAARTALVDARRALALAMHLSPRNKRAVVTSFQLAKGIIPDPVESAYSAQSLARLLLARGQMLGKQGGDENSTLSRLFIQLAAIMDPRNEDAVYAAEMHRLDHGEVDWSILTDPVNKDP